MKLKPILHPAAGALKAYGMAFGLIQLCAVGVVTTYYQSPAFQAICAHIARWKTEGGFFFSAWSCALAAGILPEIAKSFTGSARRPLNHARLKDIFFNCALFAASGVLTDILYRAQGVVFGNGIDVRTLGAKVLVDQLIWTPFFALPFCLLFFVWRNNRFNLIKTLRQYTPAFYKSRIPPLLIPAWLYWIPMLCCIYAMPPALQFPLATCAMAAWSLILVFVAKTESEMGQGEAGDCRPAMDLAA